jgi:hypothetical protein
MLTTARRSLSLSGGRIIIDQTAFPSYSPNGQQFPWEEDVDVINTPDIDPSFFTDDPFKKMSNNAIDNYMDDNMIIGNQNSFNDETSQQSIQQTLEDNVFIDLSQLISESTEENCMTVTVNEESFVSPSHVLNNTYIASTTAPVLHYLQPQKTIESIVSSVSIPVITNIIDMTSSHSEQESYTLSQPQQVSSPSHSSQSLTPPMTSSPSYIPSSSPALSYTSSTTQSYFVPSVEAMNTDSNATIDTIIETKPELNFLQPTVINDHLYTLPSSTSSKRKSSVETKDKYQQIRKKNNMASKKSRITKRDKQKQMDEKIAFYVEDNKKCKEMIDRMEKEIEWCKNYLFSKVVGASKSQTSK